MSTIFIVLPLSKHYKYPNQLLSSNLSWTFSHSRVEVKILVQYYLNVLCFRICKYSCHSKKSTLVGFPSWQYPQEWQQWQLLKKVEVIEVRSEMFWNILFLLTWYCYCGIWRNWFYIISWNPVFPLNILRFLNTSLNE